MLNVEIVKQDAKSALEEDRGKLDVTAQLIPAERVMSASIVAKEPLFLAGQPWVNEVFYACDPDLSISWLYPEGTWIPEPAKLVTIHGNARAILTAERTALNFLQTLSATATKTHQYVEQLKGFPTTLLDTRKTLPKLRYAQKYAVKLAGGVNHRMGLYDAFLIKENHICACGSITKAINAARAMNLNLRIIVEVETIDECKEALEAKPDRILLDDFSLSMLREAVALNKNYGISLEASGNISLDNIRTVAETGVDCISVGALTKSIQAIDLSLRTYD